MIYLLAITVTLVSILVMVMLFDHQLYSSLVSKFHRVFLRLRRISFKRPKINLRLPSTSTIKHLPIVPVLSLLAIVVTVSTCYFLITHNSLAVYHTQDAPLTATNTQVSELLIGERLSPPPPAPEELFDELEAEIASYQAEQADEGYWPDSTPNAVRAPTPLLVPEPDISALNTQDYSSGYSGDILNSHLSSGQISIKNADRNWKKMNSEFVQRLLTVYKVMKDQYGYDMVLLEGYRSPARQARLLNKGKHVTGAGAYKSYHQFGLAGDSAFIRNGKIVITERDPWAMQGYKLYGKVAKSAGLVWGGDWRLMDLGHVELRKKGVLGKPEMAEILTSQ